MSMSPDECQLTICPACREKAMHPFADICTCCGFDANKSRAHEPVSDETLIALDEMGLALTRGANPPNPDARYSVWDPFGHKGYGPTIPTAITDYFNNL